jgi:hypothetical protein
MIGAEVRAMPWKRIVAAAVVLLLGAAFLAGYVPERRLRMAAEEQARLAQDRLAAAEARVRFGELLGEVLTVKEVTMRQNYGQAQELSSSFFDRVRAEASETREMAFREALNEILAKRDAVTAALTKADTGVVETLHTMELRLRRALGYSVSPEPAPR